MRITDGSRDNNNLQNFGLRRIKPNGQNSIYSENWETWNQSDPSWQVDNMESKATKRHAQDEDWDTTLTDGALLEALETEETKEYRYNLDIWMRDCVLVNKPEVDPECLSHVADELLRSHLHMACSAAWYNGIEDLIVWVDLPYKWIQDMGTRVVVDRSWRGRIKRRSYAYTSLYGYSFALSPSMAQFRFKPGRIWEDIGFEFCEEPMPEVHESDPVRFLKLDVKRSLQRPYRERLLSLIDIRYENYQNQCKDGIWVGEICRTYGKEDAEGIFPHLFKDKTYEEVLMTMVDGPDAQGKTSTH